MDVSDNAPEQADDSLASSPNTFWKTVGPAMLVLGGVVCVMGIAKLLPLFIAQHSDQVLRTTLAIAAVCLAVAMTLRHRRQWVLPSLRMRQLIHDARLGRAPIEEVAESDFGCLHELGAEVTRLLQDLRQQRQAVSELKDEVKQRIANRTNVLERTIASLRNQAVRDPLTGLYNRRMLDQLLPQLITQFQTEHKSLTLIMIDLDYFKKLNDTLGHAAGDEMLKAVGQVIHSTIRDGDFGFRYGGDEFVLLLPGCDAAISKKVCERLQSLVSSIGKTYKLAQSPKLSMGISNLAELAEPNAANLLKKADDRLYETKARRNHPSPASPAMA